MKAARFLLACAAVSLLAACSANPVAPNRDESPADGVAPPSTRSNEGSTTTCTGTLTLVTKPDGTVGFECVTRRLPSFPAAA
jgi:hypothetical protein